MKNPFPGPQPYRAADRERFFGREGLSYKLADAILANRCVTVYGPSGAGKSSLAQASVLPALVERHDARLVHVDTWPDGQEPTRWVAEAMYADLGLGALPAEAAPKEAVLAAAKAAARASSRLMVIYLDQIEQLLFTHRTAQETRPFFECLEELADLPLRTVRVVISLREDYLGRFRDRLRDMRRITENGLRVGPLTVAELTEAVVVAATSGDPPQSWSIEQMRGLMLQVRVVGQSATDEAEAQSVYAQIVCRALFEERAQGKALDATEAEAILRRYLETTLAALGPLRAQAQLLLEDHLVGADGSRTLRTEQELGGRLIGQLDLESILKQLEGAAILRAEEHQGSRYFEIGHDWLARWVSEQRQERERTEEQRRVEEEQARQLAVAREHQRRLRRLAVAALVVAALVGAAAVVALIARAQAVAAQRSAEDAMRQAERAEQAAARERDEANDLRVMMGNLALRSQSEPTGAMKLLSEVKMPEERAEWIAYANEALRANALFVTLRGHRQHLVTAAFSPDGRRVLTASADRSARVWSADGTGQAIVLEGHPGEITSATFSPGEAPSKRRVLTTSADGTARLWSLGGAEATSIVLPGKPADETGKLTVVTSGAWSPDGERVVVASMVTEPADPRNPEGQRKQTVVTRVHAASDGRILGEHMAHGGRVHCAAFVDDARVVTASEDGSARVWDGATGGRIVELPGHTAPVLFVTVSRDARLLVTTSRDAKARVFRIEDDGSIPLHATLEGHTREVVHAAVRRDGKLVATASTDRTARLWNIESQPRKGEEVVLSGHAGAVTFVALHPADTRLVATASSDHVGRIFRVDAPDEPFLLIGHDAPVRSIVWSPAGERLVTAAASVDRSASADHTARVWTAPPAAWMAPRTRRPRGAAEGASGVFHAAAFSGDGRVFAAAYDDGTVELREVNGASEPVSLAAQKGEARRWISAAAPSPDGERVALASLGVAPRDGASPGEGALGTKHVLYVYQRREPDRPVKRIEVGAAIRHLAWSAAGDRIAAALEDGTALVFRMDGDAPPATFRGHTAWLTSATLSPDGRRLVTTSLDRTALIFDAEKGGAPLERHAHPDAVYAAAFDPTGRRIATASGDGKVRLVEVGGSGGPIELDGKAGELSRVAWSADGTRIAAASSNGTIVVWSGLAWPVDDARSPFALETKAPAVALEFLGEGQQLIAAAADRTYSWELDLGKLKRDLQDTNRDCLPIEERVLYLNEPPDVATRSFQECERAHGRLDLPRPHQPAADDRDLVRARVLVLPGDAEVELDGAPIGRRDGLIELSGHVGDRRRLTIVDGDTSIEKDVTIGPDGASPPTIDLAEETGQKNGVTSSRPRKPGEGDFDSLMPGAFQ
ncbi:WD40 repeat domain-containing protein [Sorangium sp. So ce429]